MDLQVREGGYDQKVNETVSVVAAKGTEVGQKAWGFMRGVVAMASQQVEAYTKDGISSSSNQHGSNYGSLDSRGGSVGYQELNGNHAWDAPAKSNDGWEDWEGAKKVAEPKPQTTTKKETGSWAGWDDHEDDHQSSTPSKKADDGWGDDSWDAGFK
jgi:ADP-ribosylation factor GTPase-activating protein 1